MNMTDRQKNSRMTSEDREFFEQFYLENRKLIYYFASKIALTDNCEDLVHDTVVRLMSHTPALRQISDNKSKVANYLYQTVRSEYIDQIRKEKQEASKLADDDTRPAEALQDLEADLERAQEIELVKDNLTEQEWMLLHKRYILGYSAEELGQLKGCSPNSVRMTLSRTRRKAKKILLENRKKGGNVHE